MLGLVALEMTTCMELARKDLNVFEQRSDFMTFQGFPSSEVYSFVLRLLENLLQDRRNTMATSRHLGIVTFANFMCLVQAV